MKTIHVLNTGINLTEGRQYLDANYPRKVVNRTKNYNTF